MKTTEQLFREICDASQLELAVQSLSEPELSRLIGWLRLPPIGGIRRLVLGVAEADAVRRYLKACPP